MSSAEYAQVKQETERISSVLDSMSARFGFSNQGELSAEELESIRSTDTPNFFSEFIGRNPHMALVYIFTRCVNVGQEEDIGFERRAEQIMNGTDIEQASDVDSFFSSYFDVLDQLFQITETVANASNPKDNLQHHVFGGSSNLFENSFLQRAKNGKIYFEMHTLSTKPLNLEDRKNMRSEDIDKFTVDSTTIVQACVMLEGVLKETIETNDTLNLGAGSALKQLFRYASVEYEAAQQIQREVLNRMIEAHTQLITGQITAEEYRQQRQAIQNTATSMFRELQELSSRQQDTDAPQPRVMLQRSEAKQVMNNAYDIEHFAGAIRDGDDGWNIWERTGMGNLDVIEDIVLLPAPHSVLAYCQNILRDKYNATDIRTTIREALTLNEEGHNYELIRNILNIDVAEQNSPEFEKIVDGIIDFYYTNVVENDKLKPFMLAQERPKIDLKQIFDSALQNKIEHNEALAAKIYYDPWIEPFEEPKGLAGAYYSYPLHCERLRKIFYREDKLEVTMVQQYAFEPLATLSTLDYEEDGEHIVKYKERNENADLTVERTDFDQMFKEITEGSIRLFEYEKEAFKYLIHRSVELGLVYPLPVQEQINTWMAQVDGIETLREPDRLINAQLAHDIDAANNTSSVSGKFNEVKETILTKIVGVFNSKLEQEHLSLSSSVNSLGASTSSTVSGSMTTTARETRGRRSRRNSESVLTQEQPKGGFIQKARSSLQAMVNKFNKAGGNQKKAQKLEQQFRKKQARLIRAAKNLDDLAGLVAIKLQHNPNKQEYTMVTDYIFNIEDGAVENKGGKVVIDGATVRKGVFKEASQAQEELVAKMSELQNKKEVQQER